MTSEEENMYQIRIDCFDETLKGIRTLFEYDIQSK